MHRPSDDNERARVEAAGGFVTTPSGSDDEPRLNGLYSVTRALGGVGAEGTAGLSHEPDVVTLARAPEQHLLVVASDGVWDAFPNHAAAKKAVVSPPPLSVPNACPHMLMCCIRKIMINDPDA